MTSSAHSPDVPQSSDAPVVGECDCPCRCANCGCRDTDEAVARCIDCACWLEPTTPESDSVETARQEELGESLTEAWADLWAAHQHGEPCPECTARIDALYQARETAVVERARTLHPSDLYARGVADGATAQRVVDGESTKALVEALRWIVNEEWGWDEDEEANEYPRRPEHTCLLARGGPYCRTCEGYERVCAALAQTTDGTP